MLKRTAAAGVVVTLMIVVAAMVNWARAADGPAAPGLAVATAQPAVTETEPVRVNGLDFQLVAPTVWGVLGEKQEATIPLMLKVTNQTGDGVALNLNDTIDLTLKDADGKELPIDIKRLRTGICPPLLVEKGKSCIVDRTAKLQPVVDKPGQFRLVGSDGIGGVWQFEALKPGKYTLCMTYDSDRANFRAKDVAYWVGKATTKELGVEITDKNPLSSKPFEKDGLQVTVTLAKETFAAEALDFKVQFKNVSEKPFNLFNADHLEDWQIRFAKQGPGGPDWHAYGMDVAGERKLTVTKVDPGQVVRVPVVVDDLKSFARILSGGKEEQVKPGKYLLFIEMDQGDNRANDPAPAVKYWTGRITTDPLEFEIADKPAALSSKPVKKDGLQVTVTLPKATFATGEQPKFTVQFKNVSDKPFTLYDIDWFWSWSIRFDNLTNKGPWQLRLGAKVERSQDSVRALVCKPGETVEMLVDLTSKDLFPFDFFWYGEQTKQPVPPLKQLEPGKYRLTVEVNLMEGPARKDEAFWTGQITTEPVEFVLADKSAKVGAAPAADTESPHGQALALVLATQQKAIREIEKQAGSLRLTGREESWWFDTTRRTWSVARPFVPGIMDSTHMFDVRYAIDDKETGAWSVDTHGQKVTQEHPPGTSAAAPALTVTIAEPLYQKQRALSVGSKESCFHVVVTNVSKQPQKVWREWCSWGYFNLTLKVIDEAGKETVLTKKLREWDQNSPDYCVLDPGDMLVIKVRPAEWINFPMPVANKETKIRLQAIYEIKPDKETAAEDVWTGRIESETKAYVLVD